MNIFCTTFALAENHRDHFIVCLKAGIEIEFLTFSRALSVFDDL